MTWTDPYLETCCRAALHRLMLCGPGGRPGGGGAGGIADEACLARLAAMGFAIQQQGRWRITTEGAARHGQEIAPARAERRGQ